MTSVVLWVSGSRFAKGHMARYGAMPRLTWMFRRSPDPELEGHRRRALFVLPPCVLGAVLYLAASPSP